MNLRIENIQQWWLVNERSRIDFKCVSDGMLRDLAWFSYGMVNYRTIEVESILIVTE
jgi:hypothetical protein